MTAYSNSGLGDQKICDALGVFCIHPDRDQIARIRDYTSLLLKWNRSVSLTTVTDPVEIVRRHFGESMFASKLLPVENCRLADVGSGAGFPGLALKILSPAIQLVLIDANKKKCAFLWEVVRALGLSGVEIFPDRIEQIRSETMRADIVTARAVGEFKLLLNWAAGALVRRGHVVLWVGSEDATRIASNASWIWQPAVKIPDSQRRFVLIGRPTVDTTVDR